MRRLFILAIIILLGLSSIIAKAEDSFIGFGEVKERNWGGVDNGWPSIFSMNNVIKIKGPNGMLGIRLSDNVPEISNNTELLLHFDKISFGNLVIDGNSYYLKYSDVFPSTKVKVMGNGASVFQHIGSKIELIPEETALLYPGKKLDSFTVSFYLYPTMTFDNETVISMVAPAVEFDNKLSGFKLIFKNSKLTWEFLNIFGDNKGNFKDIRISELDQSPIYEWHHHMLHYNADKGVIILYVDGKESAIEWITDNGEENGTILNGMLPNSLIVPLKIGGNFVGYMDEFLISRGKEEDIRTGKYKNTGEVVSDILQFKSRIVNIAKIKWDGTESNGTAIRVMYRISDNYFLPDDVNQNENPDSLNTAQTNKTMKLRNEPEWKIVRNGEIIRESGRYFQWKAILYGTNNMYTPVLKNLNLYYEENWPPSKPILLSALPGDGTVTLNWVANKEDDIAGYKIYYGNESHNYFGKGSSSGDSPITVGNITTIKIKGLTNEKVYFFSITALDKSGQESSFSKELVVRPSTIYKK